MNAEEYRKVLVYLNDTLDMVNDDMTYMKAQGIAEDRLITLPLELVIDNTIKRMLSRCNLICKRTYEIKEKYSIRVTTIYMVGEYVSSFVPKDET